MCEVSYGRANVYTTTAVSARQVSEQPDVGEFVLVQIELLHCRAGARAPDWIFAFGRHSEQECDDKRALTQAIAVELVQVLAQEAIAALFV